MPPPLSLQLSRRVRQLLPVIRGGVASGLSSRAINDAIRNSTGSGIRRQVLLDIMREIRGIQQAGDRLKNVRLDRVPDPSRVRRALTPIRREFGSTVRISGLDLNTGQSLTRHVTVTHDAVLTRGEIEDIALGFLEDDKEEYPIVLTAVLLVEQVRRA